MNIKLALGKVAGVLGAVAKITLSLGGAVLAKVLNRHDILLLDCSGSMSGSISDLRRDSSKYVQEMSKNDYISIIIFSGHGTAKRIAGPTRMDEEGKRLVCTAIERHVKVMGTTVFSEPLSLALEAAQDAAGEKLMHSSILFTDGCQVPTKWSVAEERRKALEQASRLGAFGSFLSCIGYSFYYDEAFLRELISANGGNGVYTHISEIGEFREAIEAIKAVAQKLTKVQVTLSISTDKGLLSLAYRTTPEVIPVSLSNKISVTALYDGTADLYFEVPAGAKVTVAAVVDGKKVTSPKSEVLDEQSQANYLRIMGVEAFVAGDLVTAQAMFERTGDELLADNVGGAFSTRDTLEAGNIARAYFRENKFIGSGLKAAGPNYNVLNALRTLIEDSTNVVSLPKGAYKRSGVAMTDPRVISSPLGSTLKVKGYVSNQERFNFSIRALKTVQVLPEGGSGAPQTMDIWRTYNVILDGNLWTPELLASLSEDSFNALQEAGVVEANEVYKKGRSYLLNFRKLKLTSPAWANPTTLRLVDLFQQEAEFEAEQKVLNARVKTLSTESRADSEGNIYFPKSKKVEGVEEEYYSAPCCEYRLMGYKASDYDCSKLNLEQARDRVKEVRQQLVRVRFMIRSIVFSIETTKSRVIKWDEGKTTSRGSVPKLEQLATFEGAKLKRVTWTEQQVCS